MEEVFREGVEDTREEVEEGDAREVVEEVEGGCREEAGQEVVEGGATEHSPVLDPPVIYNVPSSMVWFASYT